MPLRELEIMSLVKRVARKVIYRLVDAISYLVDWLVPKSASVWIINSHLGLNGNARALVHYVLSRADLVYATIYIERDCVDESTYRYIDHHFGGRVRWYKRDTLSSALIAFRAKYVFVTHDVERDIGVLINPLGRRRVVVNLWHGIEMKIHWMLTHSRNSGPARKSSRFSAIAASSSIDAVAKCAVFGKQLRDTWVTGNPRNDFLFLERLPDDLAWQKEKIDSLVCGKRLVLYAPTWRRYKEQFDPLPLDKLSGLVDALARSNAVLGLRLHPKDQEKFGAIYSAGSFINLSSEIVPEAQILLRQCDVLVTDYSSIWLDYLLLDKPMIAFWPDREDYGNSRGVIWELDQIFPGPIVESLEELADALEVALRGNGKVQDNWRSRYEFTKRIMHKFTDGSSSARLIERIMFCK